MEFVTRELAERLAKNWVDGYTLSGRTAFIANEKERQAILDEATLLGNRQTVYAMAIEIIQGKK